MSYHKKKSMRVLSNPILGSMFKRYRLILNDEGLFREVCVNQSKEYFFITDDVRVICNIIDIDFDKFNDLIDTEVFDLITNSSIFNFNIFVNRKPVKSELLTIFRTYVYDKNIINENSEHITYERIKNITGIDIESKIEYIKLILTDFDTIGKDKFNLLKRNLIDSGYDVTNFSTDIPNFKNSFINEFEYKKFMVETNDDSIVNYFKKLR